MEAVALAQEFELAVKELPSKYELTLAYGDAVKAVAAGYNKLTEYQKGFISDDTLKAFTEKYERYNELVKAQEAANGTEGGTESTEGTENTESSDNTGAEE